MATVKINVQNLLNKLPDNVTLEDIQYNIVAYQTSGDFAGWNCHWHGLLIESG